jgi:hypothetical protein
MELEVGTQRYWQISLLFNQGIGQSLTCSQAIRTAGEAANHLGPHRSVKYKLLRLQDQIIRGRRKKKSKSQCNIILIRFA